jgi:beta-galactosidase/beta-glucuronidase
MEDLVRRDLNHPSVVMWSIGNEGELQVCFFFVCAPCVCVCVCVCFCVSVCVSISARFRLCVCHPSVSPFGVGILVQDPAGAIGPSMRDAVLRIDPKRPITANMNKPSSAALTDVLDVQGVSHSSVPGTPSQLYRDVNYSFPWFHEQHPQLSLVSSRGSTQIGSPRSQYQIFRTTYTDYCLALSALGS